MLSDPNNACQWAFGNYQKAKRRKQNLLYCLLQKVITIYNVVVHYIEGFLIFSGFVLQNRDHSVIVFILSFWFFLYGKYWEHAKYFSWPHCVLHRCTIIYVTWPFNISIIAVICLNILAHVLQNILSKNWHLWLTFLGI